MIIDLSFSQLVLSLLALLSAAVPPLARAETSPDTYSALPAYVGAASYSRAFTNYVPYG